MGLDTTGSIASHIARSFALPIGVSGNLLDIVDLQRIEVQNFTGISIDKDSIPEKLQTSIVNFSKAQALDEAFAWATTLSSLNTGLVISGGNVVGDLSLGELSVNSSSFAEAESLKAMSSISRDTPKQLRDMAIISLKNVGRVVRFARSTS